MRRWAAVASLSSLFSPLGRSLPPPACDIGERVQLAGARGGPQVEAATPVWLRPLLARPPPWRPGTRTPQQRY